MKVDVYYPKDEKLKKLIDCFYFIERDSNDETFTYLTFPSNNFIMSGIINSEILKVESSYVIKSTKKESFFCSLVGKFNKPILFEYQDEIFELTIYFKPLGINFFLEENLNCYNEGVDVFFNFQDDFELFTNELYAIKNNIKRANILEKYLIDKIRSYHHPFLFSMVEDIIFTDDFNLKEFSIELGLSQKTIIEQSKIHLLKTPNQIKKINRFRKILKNANMSNSIKISDIDQFASYFDQSHMIKEFKKFTGLTPKLFFSKINQTYSKEISWILK